jgi:hypothetical protein
LKVSLVILIIWSPSSMFSANLALGFKKILRMTALTIITEVFAFLGIGKEGGKPKHQCSNCSKGFSGPSHLKIHERVHTGERPYQCDVCCNKTFNQKSNLDRHKMAHRGEKKLSCTVCSKRFIEKRDLKVHVEIHYMSKFEETQTPIQPLTILFLLCFLASSVDHSEHCWPGLIYL